ncbi:carotenoid oxygenase-like, putative [Bodo saltans]|uniref:Carotenoid oxygenase-like, putative n=1 Tax=Bodo saltans TaxID=75058 RepID=A0A0S4IY68_BODSA|nr:carotenoid oxygenase-like, putative [Bodo saltans]|eukprot:CUG06885.1 carotenoid oxygenase-like, putative [Bodo saltans]
MLHGVWFSPAATARGAAFYANRYVETSSFKLNQEESKKTGKRFFYSIFMDLRGPWNLISFLLSSTVAAFAAKIPFVPSFLARWLRSRWRSRDNNNTAVLHHNGKLYALVESGAPHEVSPQNLASVGRETFGGKLSHPFTAHPKTCPTTGECLFFGYSSESPFCSLSSVLKNGVKAPSVEVPLDEPIMMHDFGITPNYAIIIDIPLAFTPKAIVKGKNVYSWVDNHPSRVGLVARSAIHDRTVRTADSPAQFDDHDVKKGLRKVPVQWFSMKNPCFIFHVASSYEEDRFNTGTQTSEKWVVLFTVSYAPGFDLDVLGGIYNGNNHEHDVTLMGIMTRYECCLTTGELRETAASGNISCEFPVIHNALVGLPVKYCYVAANREGDTRVDLNNPIRLGRLVKFELPQMNVVASFEFPVGSYIGEFSFVPSAGMSEEDSGHLVGYVTEQVMTEDRANGALIRCLHSYTAVLCARTMTLVTKIPLPHVVPLGFHGTFIEGIEHVA